MEENRLLYKQKPAQNRCFVQVLILLLPIIAHILCFCASGDRPQKYKTTLFCARMDENCRKRYDTFTDSEITDLLVNRKWYKTIDQGIQNLYVTVANHLTKRIVELYERYENTLPELTAKLAEEEKEVAAHLAQIDPADAHGV